MLNIVQKFLKTRKKLDLVIFDDVYPQPISLFRFVEFNYYLEHIKKAAAYSTGISFHLIEEKRSVEEVIEEFEGDYPHLKNKVAKFDIDDKEQEVNAKLAYMVFLSNAYTFLEIIEKNKIPFVFTLYPGGGFALNQPEVDEKLKKVFSSPYYKGVIVTQKITYDYLIKNKFCPKSSIKFIYGAIHDTTDYDPGNTRKKYYPSDKKTFDICFVANKYMKQGKDKGYDIFIKSAKKLSTLHKDIRFHVVGPFTKEDIDVKELKNKIKFYGFLKSEKLGKFFTDKDIILSPNKPFILGPGLFDGFPTGACIEAGLVGVALFVSDELNSNIIFKDKKDIVIVPPNVSKIVKVVNDYYSNPEALYKLAKAGRESIIKHYDFNSQMQQRLHHLNLY